MIMSTYIVLVLCHNEIQYIKPFFSLADAEAKAIALANKWYKIDMLSTVEEMQKYYGSKAYLDSEDFAHICIEAVSVK